MRAISVRGGAGLVAGVLVAVVLVAGALQLSAAPASAADKCDPAPLAQALHDRMKSDGKSDAEIVEILASGFKRGILRGRVVKGSDCSAEQVDKALDELAGSTKG